MVGRTPQRVEPWATESEGLTALSRSNQYRTKDILQVRTAGPYSPCAVRFKLASDSWWLCVFFLHIREGSLPLVQREPSLRPDGETAAQARSSVKGPLHIIQEPWTPKLMAVTGWDFKAVSFLVGFFMQKVDYFPWRKEPNVWWQ